MNLREATVIRDKITDLRNRVEALELRVKIMEDEKQLLISAMMEEVRRRPGRPRKHAENH